MRCVKKLRPSLGGRQVFLSGFLDGNAPLVPMGRIDPGKMDYTIGKVRKKYQKAFTF